MANAFWFVVSSGFADGASVVSGGDIWTEPRGNGEDETTGDSDRMEGVAGCDEAAEGSGGDGDNEGDGETSADADAKDEDAPVLSPGW